MEAHFCCYQILFLLFLSPVKMCIQAAFTCLWKSIDLVFDCGMALGTLPREQSPSCASWLILCRYHCIKLLYNFTELSAQASAQQKGPLTISKIASMPSVSLHFFTLLYLSAEQCHYIICLRYIFIALPSVSHLQDTIFRREGTYLFPAIFPLPQVVSDT